MKALLLIALLTVSSLSFANSIESEPQLGERVHLMTGGENCNSTLDNISENYDTDLITKDSGVVSN